ncbi:MAG: hypothetical protein HN904_05730 [Victivallales bacterium]|jgi:hypothetical protein|nr:hypothetical protein [Victivallales bacterium]MBT7162258.1 hypothetical protein [Victivallales bacterium]
MSNVPPCATCTHRAAPFPPPSCPAQLAELGPAAFRGCARNHAVQRLRLDALEEIEACGNRLIQQAGHLNRLLALPDSLCGEGFDRREVGRELHKLDELLANGTTDERWACLARLRIALRVPSQPHRQPAGPAPHAPATDRRPDRDRATAPPSTSAFVPPAGGAQNGLSQDWRKAP